jgi:hypothetical protein
MDKNKLEQIGLIRTALIPIFQELAKKNTEELKELVGSLKLEPIVKVNPTIDLPELDNVITELSKLAKKDTVVTIPGIDELIEKIGNPATVQPTNIGDYRPHDQDETIPASEYFGFVSPDGKWYIINSQKGTQRYAAGQDGYVEAWGRRSKLTYGYLNEVM